MNLRNKPCPCGSGKKYKKCCMFRQTGFTQEGQCIHPPRYLVKRFDKEGKAFLKCGRCKEVVATQKDDKLGKK